MSAKIVYCGEMVRTLSTIVRLLRQIWNDSTEDSDLQQLKFPFLNALRGGSMETF